MPTIRSGETTIHYEVQGEGPALVFHTGAGGDCRMWEQAGYVAGLPGFRKILMDQRGRGQSGRPNGVEEHRMECFVADVAAVLDDARVDRAGFWGYSNGIYVGLAFGAAYPDRVKALVGTGSMPFYDICDLPPIEDPDAFIRESVEKGGVAQDVNGYMERDHERFPEAIDRNVREGDARMYALDRIGRRSWRGPKSLYGSFIAPVLLITGEKEDEERETERAVAAMPRARLVRLPGVSHLASFYRSDLALPHALPFLREHLNE